MADENGWSRQEHLLPLRELASSVWQTGLANSGELELPDKTWVLGHASPLGEAGNFWGAIIVLQNISELRRVENMRKQLIADLSHELRSPLTVIRGRAEALLDQVVEDEVTRQEYLQGIQAETVRLSNMVRDLLEMARMDNNPHFLRPELFCLKNLVYSIAEKYQLLFETKGLRLETECLSFNEQVMVRADAGRIEQAIRNFLDNAFRYAQTRIILRLMEEENTAAVEVEDDGPGIPEAELPLVWERFYKVNKARTTGDIGVGLGLAITREIIIASGGRIWLTSEEGKRTIFGFQLPKNPDDDHN
jgi:two-component system sensor histidine kinase ResE